MYKNESEKINSLYVTSTVVTVYMKVDNLILVNRGP